MIANGPQYCEMMFDDLLEEDFKKYPDVKYFNNFSESDNEFINNSHHPMMEDSEYLQNFKYDEYGLEEYHPGNMMLVTPGDLIPCDLQGNVADVSEVLMQPAVPVESFLQNNIVSIEDIIADDFIDGIANADYDPSFFDQPYNSPLLKPWVNLDFEHSTKRGKKPSFYSVKSAPKPSHLEFDHSYSAPLPQPEKEELIYCYSSPWSPDSSDSSTSGEVDVVTVEDLVPVPIVPKVEISRRVTRKRGRKSKKAQTQLSAKSLKAAMKNTRITSVRRTYRKKVSNSVETTPSNSAQSSADSSRCNSDVEDADKRANHNSSERKRREVLRSNLQTLRVNVPKTVNNIKAPKVLILNSARDYIRELENGEQDLKLQKRQQDQRRKRNEANLKSLITYFKKFC